MKKQANLIGLILVLGLVLFTGCPAEDSGNGNNDPVKSVKIESVTSSGGAGVGLSTVMPDINNPSFTAIRFGTIAGNVLTVELTVPNNGTFENPSNPWKGKGEYYVWL